MHDHINETHITDRNAEIRIKRIPNPNILCEHKEKAVSMTTYQNPYKTAFFTLYYSLNLCFANS